MIILKNYRTVETIFDLDEMMSEIKATSDPIAYDVESTGLNVRHAAIIGFGICTKVGTGWYVPTLLYKQDEHVKSKFWNKADSILKLLSTKKLIMHNGSFDIRITRNYFKVDLIDALHADTILLKHTVDEEQPFGLKEIAIKKQVQLGLDVEKLANSEQEELKENIKQNGGSTTKNNYELYKADLPVIAKYCAADCDLTLRIFELYSEILTKEKLVDFFYKEEVMPLYKLVTIPMECNGIKLDMPKLLSIKDEIILDMDKLEFEIQAKLKPYCSALKRQLLDKHVPPKNSGSLAQAVAEKYLSDLPRTKKSGKLSITKKTKETMGDEWYELFIRDGIYDKRLESFREQVFLEKTGQKYIVNIGSTDNLSAIFIDGLGETPLSTTDGGKPQMDGTMLNHLANKYEVANLIVIYKRMGKILNSYIERFLRDNDKGRFYPKYLQHGTVSGRYSSDLQQLPRPIDMEDKDSVHPFVYKYTNIIRSIFIADEKRIFIDADYTSLEPNIFANDAGDDALVNIFKNNYDMYSTVAIKAYGLEGKYSADTTSDNYLKKHEPKLRQDSKCFSLGIRYGMGAYHLSKSLNIDIEEAEAIIDNYFKAFPKLKNAMDKYLKQAKLKGKVNVLGGRIRHLPEAKKLHSKFGDILADPRKTLVIMRKHRMSKDEVKTIRKQYNNLLNNALNAPIQGASAMIINRASIAIAKHFLNNNIDAKIIANVHDQLIIDCRKEDADTLKDVVQDYMENTVKLEHVELKAPPQLAINFEEGH